MNAPQCVCGICGYDLRGLAVGCTCPECGTPNAASLLLRHRPRKWLGRLADGFGLQAFVFLYIAVVNAIQMFTAVAHNLKGVANTIFQFSGVAILALYGVAVWCVSTPEPGRLEPVYSGRKILRLSALAMIGLNGVWGFVLQYPEGERFASTACNLTLVAAWCLYAGQLARRLPERRLLLGSRLLLVGAVLTTGLTYSIGWIASFLRSKRIELWPWTDVIVSAADDVLTLYAAYLCYRFCRAIKPLAREGASPPRGAGHPPVGRPTPLPPLPV